MFVSFEVELILLLGFILLEEIASFRFLHLILALNYCSTHIYLNIS